MDNPSRVRGRQGFRDLHGELQRSRERQGRARQMPGQRLAVNELEHKGADIGRVLNTVNRGDMWMIERREKVRFASEPGEPFGI